ncbi:hypothetical protein FHB93_28410 [Klebsiella quasipneumoniae]|nr:hypothetical protein FHB93_28410 [Klebsiella quasipneumoniae]
MSLVGQGNKPRSTKISGILYNSEGHCCKVSDEAAFWGIARPDISKTLVTRRISPRGSPY